MELFDGHKAHMPTGSGRRKRWRRTISGQDEEAEKKMNNTLLNMEQQSKSSTSSPATANSQKLRHC